MPMPSTRAIPALLNVLVGLLRSLVVLGLVRDRNYEISMAPMRTPDGMLLAMLALAVFAVGVSPTYVLLALADG